MDIALVLNSTAPTAAYEVGAIDGLLDGGHQVSALAATGFGAVIAAIIVSSHRESTTVRLRKFWGDFVGTEPSNPQILKDLVYRYVDFDLLSGSASPPLMLALHNLSTGDLVLFDSRSVGVRAEHIIAGASWSDTATLIDGEFYGSFRRPARAALLAMNELLGEQQCEEILPIIQVIPTLSPAAFYPGKETLNQRYMELDIVNDLLDAPDTARKYVWSKYLIRLAIPESGNDGFLSFEPETLGERLAAGYKQGRGLDVAAGMPPVTELPKSSWVAHSTILSIGPLFPDFNLAFVAGAVISGETAVEKRPPPARVNDVIAAVAALLGQQNPAMLSQFGDLNRLAASIVYDIQIPVTFSPMQGMPLARLVAMIELAVVHDPAHAGLIILAAPTAMILLGCAQVVQAWLAGLEKRAELLGESGKLLFDRTSLPPSPGQTGVPSPHDSASTAEQAHKSGKVPKKGKNAKSNKDKKDRG